MLRNGFILGKEPDGLFFNDKEMAAQHAIINYDFKKSWNIECLAPQRMRLGSEELSRATLVLGLIFHLGQTGFKVVERPPRASGLWKKDLADWLLRFPARQTSTEIFFFSNPIRLSFIQGPQYEDFYTLGYGPRELGYNNLDLNITDPSAPGQVVKFFQIGKQPCIENLCGDRATINGSGFDQHFISQGDILRVSSSVIELSILT